MKGSDYIVASLESKGVNTVFELSGGMIAHLLDSFSRNGRIRVVSMHHEQGAAFAAEGFARMTGIPGVALATSGPGAINLLTGIGSCHFDSTPGVFITGQVNRHEMKGSRGVRQLGFQETDIVSMARPITKAAWRATTPEEVPELLDRAFALALSGRPGPVLLDVPMDIQRANIDAPLLESGSPGASTDQLDEKTWDSITTQLRQARRPLILAGGGIPASRTIEFFRKLAQQLQIPVVNSLMGVDVLPYGHPLRVGMIGSYGNRWANWAIGTADCLLVLGSRLDVRQTGSETEAFKGDRNIIHVDCDASEVNNRVLGCTAAICSMRSFLTEALSRFSKLSLPDCSEWKAQIAAKRAEWPDTGEVASAKGINPNEFMHALSQVSGKAGAYVVDVGQHQMWAAQSLELTESQRFLTSGGMGSMGFALPAAVGTAFAQPGVPMVVIAGDGAFQCNIQELQTVVRNQLPLKIVVVNNGCHGMVRQFQESYFESRYQSTMWGYSTPDFVNVASAYGMAARKTEKADDIPNALKWLWSEPAKPTLLDLRIDAFTNVYPKMAFGRPITEMEPVARPVEMEGT